MNVSIVAIVDIRIGLIVHCVDHWVFWLRMVKRKDVVEEDGTA